MSPETLIKNLIAAQERVRQLAEEREEATQAEKDCQEAIKNADIAEGYYHVRHYSRGTYREYCVSLSDEFPTVVTELKSL